MLRFISRILAGVAAAMERDNAIICGPSLTSIRLRKDHHYNALTELNNLLDTIQICIVSKDVLHLINQPTLLIEIHISQPIHSISHLSFSLECLTKCAHTGITYVVELLLTLPRQCFHIDNWENNISSEKLLVIRSLL